MWLQCDLRHTLTQETLFQYTLSMKKKNIQWVPGLRKQPTFGDTTVHWFARGITSEERAQKFHTDDESLPTADLGSASDWLKNDI